MKRILQDCTAIKNLILLCGLLLITGSAWADPQDGGFYYYYAKVTAKTASDSNGQGSVYASTTAASMADATASTSVATGQDPNNYGESTEAPSVAGQVTFYLYAKPADGYKFDGWSSSATRPDVFESTNPEWKTMFGASTTQGSQSTDNPGGTQNSGTTAENGGTQYYYSSTAEHTIYAYFSEQVMSFDVSFVQPNNGSVKIDGTSPSRWPYTLNTTTGELNTTLVATPASNYRFWGWYTLNSDGSKNYLSYDATYNASFYDAATVYAEFCPSSYAIFDVAGIPFYNLNEANAKAVANGSGKIAVVQDGVVPAGKYTIASGVTLLVPFEESNSFNTEPQVNTTDTPSRSVYRTLTLNNGVNITVNGNICVNAMMALRMGYNGSVLNKYGLIDMKAGSQITLNSGANCYAWGYIIGEGSIIAESGSTLHETFQFKHRGGNALTSIASTNASKKVFPINQYYVQSIEVPITIKKGATEKVYTGVHNVAEAVSIDFIGTSGLFNLTGTDAYLIKKYDVSLDRQNYTLYGNATIGSIKFGMSGFYKESKDFVLPITNNMTLNIESGTTTIQYETAILPDVQIKIADGAKVISSNNCYVYDSLNWKGAYAYANDYSAEEKAQIAPVVYRHGGLKYNRTNYKLRDATIDVKGEMQGLIYTTTGGANIMSSGNGKVTFTGERSATSTYQAGQDKTTGKFDAIPITPAQLRNADGTFTPTIGAPAGTEISYANGHWGWRETWKNGETTLTAFNTCAKVDDASVQSWAGINIPAGKYGKWETEIDEAKQEVVHTPVFEDIASAETLDVLDEQKITINTDATVETTTIATTGKVSVPATATLTTTDLVLGATPEESSEIIIESNKVVADNVYFDLTRGAGKVFKHHTWYAFSVPFQVDAAEILFDGQTMQYGQTSKKDDYDILYYDGSVRAAQGKSASCWKYVEKDDPTYLYPGKLYMIANTRRDVTTLRFTKVAGTALLNTSVSVSDYSSANTADANWNGIANPAVFHANMSGLGATEGIIWVYNPDADDPSNPYVEHDLTEDNIILGQAFFAQISSQQTLVVSPSTGSAVSVARRRAQAKEANKTLDRFQVTIAPAGEKATDNVIVRMDEDKEEDTYIIGTDLVRMGMSTMRPQLWVDRYDEKLCVNVIAPTNGQAEYPLGIFAPNDGEYQISVAQQPDNETTLYLTLDGKVIWNLNYNPYTATLTKGNTDRYGLLMVGNKAPEIATGVDEAVVDANGATRKVLINNHMYIIRGDQVYTINGQKIR